MQHALLSEGRQALSEGRWQDARALFEAALQKEPSPTVYEELARACWWLNDVPSVLEYREKAYQGYLDQEDFYGASRNASWLGLDYLDMKGEFAIANGWFQRAASLLEGLEASPELGMITLLKARLAYVNDDTNQRALQLVDESLVLSETFNRPEGAMMARGFKGLMLTSEGRIREGMALLDEATLMATTLEAKDVNFVTLTCCFLIDACERIRDYERAGQWCRKVREICERWNFEAMFASCRNQYASVLVWRGDWKEAEAQLLAAVRELKVLRPMYVSTSTIRLADLRRRQGKWEEAAVLLEEAGSHSLKLLHCAAFAYDQGDYATASNLAERFLRKVRLKERIRQITGLELLIRIYARQERTEEAAALLGELKEIAAIVDTLPLQAAVKSAEGVWLEATGKYAEAKQQLEDAIDLYDEIQAPFESARARVALAEVLIVLEEYPLAESALQAALKTFRQLGAEKDLEKTAHLLKNMYKTRAERQALERSLEFTGRELEVLRLIAEGKNNEEIAEQLFLSVRTVEKHLTNLYLKMGVSGKSARAFAASYAIKHHLLFK